MPKAAIAEVKWGVIITLMPRNGCCRCSSSGTSAPGSRANEKTRAKRAMSRSCLMPKTW